MELQNQRKLGYMTMSVTKIMPIFIVFSHFFKFVKNVGDLQSTVF